MGNSIVISAQSTSMFGIQTGPLATIDGHKCFVALDQGPSLHTLQRVGTNRQFQMTRDEFIAGLLSKRVELDCRLPRNQKSGETGEAQRPPADPRYLPTAIYRQYFVIEQNKLDPDKATKKDRKAAVRTAFENARQDSNVPEKLLRRKLPSMSSIYRWMKAWEPTMGPSSLIPASSASGRKGRRLHKIYEQIISDGIDDYIRTANQRRNGALADIVDRALTAYETYPELRKIPRLNRSTIYRRIRELGGEIIMALEKGKRTAHRRYAPVLGSFKVTRPLERVEIDSTKLDRIFKNLSGSMILSRGWLTTMIDVATRMTLAFEVTLTDPTSADIRRLLRKAILPKDPKVLKEMGITTPWPTLGVPKTIVTDNGKAFVAAGTKLAFALVGAEHVINPYHTPNHKPYVEIVQKTFTNQGIHESSGSTMNNPTARGERKPDTENLVTIDQIEEEVTRIICDVYHVRDHRRLGCSPIAEWERLTELYPVVPVTDDELIRQITEESVRRIVSHEGIELHGIRYNSHQLADLHRAAGKRIKHQVHYDPADMSEIRVEVPGTRRQIAVQCIDPMHAGLDLKAHQLIQKHSRSKSREIDRVAYIRNRAAMVRHNRAVAGPRPAYMLPKGYKPKAISVEFDALPSPVAINSIPAPTVKPARKSRKTGKSAAPLPSYPAEMPLQPSVPKFQPQSMPEDHIEE